MQEKEKRMANRPMSTLSGTLNGRNAPAAQQQFQRKSNMVTDEEARRRYQAGQKALQAVPEAACNDCEGD